MSDSVAPHALRQAVRCLQDGGVLAYPTEAVYGLGCHPLNETAVRRILTLKQRPEAKGLILIASDFSQLEPYVDWQHGQLSDTILDSWPGPNTWLIPATHAPHYLRGRFDTLAVRVSAHPLVRELCEAFGGAIVSTSANPAGLPPARNAFTVRRYFQTRLDFILNGPLGDASRPSLIRDAVTGTTIRA